MPQLGNRPAGADDGQGTQKATDQGRIGRAQKRRAGAGDDCAGSIGGLSKDR